MKWEIISKKLLLDKLFKVWNVKLRFKQFNGEMSNLCDWYYIEKSQSVGLILFDKVNQKILLLRQFRIISEFFPSIDAAQWPYEIVAGLIKPGENSKDAIIRECYEETGITIDSPKKLFSLFPSLGIFGELLHLYYSEIDTNKLKLTPKSNKTENEDITPELLDFGTALNMVKDGQICDAKTVIAILWLTQN